MSVSLQGVSDQELVGRLRQLVSKEKKFTFRIILHLAELDRRRLYAELGYTSMYDYATRGLGYSPASAQRRVKAARAVLCVPEVYDCLEDGRLSLAVLEVASEALADKHAREILRDVCGKSKEEASVVIAHYYPVEPMKLADKIEPVVAGKVLNKNQLSLINSDETTCLRAEASKEVGNEEQYRISFTAGEELIEKLERAKELLFAAEGVADLESIIERALDQYLARHCPMERAKRRREKEERRAKARGEKALETLRALQDVAEVVVDEMPDKDPSNSRYVSAQLRDEVFERDGHCCTYVAPDGTRCSARTALEIDHIFPWSLGGTTELENLRTACYAHNQMYARQSYGDAYIEEIIARRKPTSDGRPTVYVHPDLILDPVERMIFKEL